MVKTAVAVLFGGCSAEHDVSLQSAHSVLTHLSPERYEVIPIGITRQGRWLRYYGATDHIADDTWIETGACVPAVISPSRDVHGLIELRDDVARVTKIDVVFPVLHGKNGEDGTMQGLLELAGIPFVGCNTLSSAMCMDKDVAHRTVELAGIRTPPAVLLSHDVPADELMLLTGGLSCPLFVKPVNAGSSLGITRVSDKAELPAAVRTALSYDDRVIIEEEIKGFEVGCAVLGGKSLRIGEVDEIELTHGFFDYAEKYTRKTARIHMPARIDRETADRVKQAAARIYCALQCSGFARVDMFLTPEREIVFNEVNTIPGLTAHSRYPSMLYGVGMKFDGIVDSLIELAIDEWER